MQISITKEELYSLIKDAVREVIREKEMHHFLSSIPEVSDEEMKDVEELYGKTPPKRKAVRREILDL